MKTTIKKNNMVIPQKVNMSKSTDESSILTEAMNLSIEKIQSFM